MLLRQHSQSQAVDLTSELRSRTKLRIESNEAAPSFSSSTVCSASLPPSDASSEEVSISVEASAVQESTFISSTSFEDVIDSMGEESSISFDEESSQQQVVRLEKTMYQVLTRVSSSSSWFLNQTPPTSKDLQEFKAEIKKTIGNLLGGGSWISNNSHLVDDVKQKRRQKKEHKKKAKKTSAKWTDKTKVEEVETFVLVTTTTVTNDNQPLTDVKRSTSNACSESMLELEAKEEEDVADKTEIIAKLFASFESPLTITTSTTIKIASVPSATSMETTTPASEATSQQTTNPHTSVVITIENEVSASTACFSSSSVSSSSSKSIVQAGLSISPRLSRSPRFRRRDTRFPHLLVLDLDGTLVHSEFRRRPFQQHDFSLFDEEIFVFKRPYLDHFVSTISEWFELAVWTASGCEYAAQIVKHIFPDPSKISFIFSSERCTNKTCPYTGERLVIKDMKKVKRLGYDLRQVLIVDDTPSTWQRNYGNAIHIESYWGSRVDDNLLLLLQYLEYLGNQPNMRIIDKRQWKHKMLYQLSSQADEEEDNENDDEENENEENDSEENENDAHSQEKTFNKEIST